MARASRRDSDWGEDGNRARWPLCSCVLAPLRSVFPFSRTRRCETQRRGDAKQGRTLRSSGPRMDDRFARVRSGWSSPVPFVPCLRAFVVLSPVPRQGEKVTQRRGGAEPGEDPSHPRLSACICGQCSGSSPCGRGDGRDRAGNCRRRSKIRRGECTQSPEATRDKRRYRRPIPDRRQRRDSATKAQRHKETTPPSYPVPSTPLSAFVPSWHPSWSLVVLSRLTA